MERRLRRLPRATLSPGATELLQALTGRDPHGSVDLAVAAGRIPRLVGLAGPRVEPVDGMCLLLPGTRSVHTFGMAFALDLVWLDAMGRPIAIDLSVPRRSVRSCRAARCVIELPSTVPRSPRSRRLCRLTRPDRRPRPTHLEEHQDE